MAVGALRQTRGVKEIEEMRVCGVSYLELTGKASRRRCEKVKLTTRGFPAEGRAGTRVLRGARPGPACVGNGAAREGEAGV